MHRYSGNTVEGIRGDEIGGCSSKLQLDAAMMYFSETDTPKAAEQLREKDEYLDNKKNGAIGDN